MSRQTAALLAWREPVPIMAELQKYVSGLDSEQEKLFTDCFKQYRWTQIREKLGLSDFKFHNLRKTFGSVLAQNGVSTAQEIHRNEGHAGQGQHEDRAELRVVVSNITDRKAAEELRKHRTRLKEMASMILQAEDRERRRLAIGMHDDICQKLIMSKLALEASLPLIPDANVSASLKIVSESIGEVIKEADSLTFSLSNPILHELDFAAVIKEYLRREIQKRHGIAVEFESDGQ